MSRPKVKKWHSTYDTMPKEGRCCIFEITTTDGKLLFLIGYRKGSTINYGYKYLCDIKLITRWCYIDLLNKKE